MASVDMAEAPNYLLKATRSQFSAVYKNEEAICIVAESLGRDALDALVLPLLVKQCGGSTSSL